MKWYLHETSIPPRPTSFSRCWHLAFNPRPLYRIEIRQETQTTDNRQQTTDNRQQATGNRQQTTDNKQQTTGNRQQPKDNRQQATDNRQQTTDEHIHVSGVGNDSINRCRNAGILPLCGACFDFCCGPHLLKGVGC